MLAGVLLGAASLCLDDERLDDELEVGEDVVVVVGAVVFWALGAWSPEALCCVLVV